MKKNISIIILFCMLISSSTVNHNAIRTFTKCITPISKLSQIIVFSINPDLYKYKEISPIGNWTIKGELPFDQSSSSSLYYRPVKNELWFRLSNSGKIYRYAIDTGKWDFCDQIDEYKVIPSRLLFSDDGTIWGGDGLYVSSNGNEGKHFFLSKFNDATNKFETILDGNKINGDGFVSLNSNILELPGNNLWFVSNLKNEYSLYSYNYADGSIVNHFLYEDGRFHQLATDGVDKIFFTDIAKNTLVSYSTTTNEFIEYDADMIHRDKRNKINTNFIFYDNTDKLFIGNLGWFDFSKSNFPEWHVIPDVPVYASQIRNIDGLYITLPVTAFQDSRGTYWFSGFYGISQYNIENNDWCLMTTGAGPVVEDNNHTLWIAIFNHLYSYNLE